jgi:hypothetical protein
VLYGCKPIYIISLSNLRIAKTMYYMLKGVTGSPDDFVTHLSYDSEYPHELWFVAYAW